MKRALLFPVIAIILLALACGGGGTATTTTSTTAVSSTALPGTVVTVEGGGNYWEITAAQLAGFKTKDFFLVDADASYVGEIANTDLFIKPADIAQNLDKFPADKTAKIVLYCTMGVQSRDAAVTLVKAGYTRVMELSGGIVGWQNQGYPITVKTRTMI